MERLTLLLAFLFVAALGYGQEADRLLRKGNAAYERGDLPDAVDIYSKVDKDERGTFNLGNAYYRQDSVAHAQRAFENAATTAKDPAAQARAYHNLGNTWMRQGNFKEAITAYKEALKRVPSDGDTRYNLAYAQQMLQQEQEQQEQGGGDEDQEQDDNSDQDQQSQDQQDQDGDQEQEDQQQEQGQDQQKPEPRPDQEQRIDPQDAMRMLDAAQQQEKDVQEKVRELMQPQPSKPAEKDW